jgi:hypothetical protein
MVLVHSSWVLDRYNRFTDDLDRNVSLEGDDEYFKGIGLMWGCVNAGNKKGAGPGPRLGCKRFYHFPISCKICGATS